VEKPGQSSQDPANHHPDDVVEKEKKKKGIR
jgi:hypothetical protein